MITIPPDFKDHLESGVTTLCTCWHIARVDGVNIGFTDHDLSIWFDGIDFQPNSGASGSALQASNDLAVDNGEIAGLLDSDLIQAEDILAGLFDDARVAIWKVNWQNPEERVLLRTNLIGQITKTQQGFRAELRGLSHLLDQTVGRLYQRQCDALVGDSRCGVDLNQPAFQSEATVQSLEGTTAFTVSGLENYEAGWFDHGQLKWLTGRNAGLAAFIKSHGVGNAEQSITLWQAPAFMISPGDTFTLTAGCDRYFETCTHKFSNALNFRGFHLMPGNDFIITIPTRGSHNDGGRR